MDKFKSVQTSHISSNISSHVSFKIVTVVTSLQRTRKCQNIIFKEKEKISEVADERRTLRLTSRLAVYHNIILTLSLLVSVDRD
jgi:hypothetical protein